MKFKSIDDLCNNFYYGDIKIHKSVISVGNINDETETGYSEKILKGVIFRLYEYYENKFISTYRIDEQDTTSKDIIVVSYSGGRDSTYLIYKNLEKGYKVLPIINILNSESMSREATITHFVALYNLCMLGKMFPKQIIIPNQGSFINSTHQIYNCSNLVLSQQPYNAYALSLGIPNKLFSRVKECQIAFIMGDHGLSFLDELKRIYNAFIKFNRGYYDTKYNPPLKFPLIKAVKSDINSFFFTHYELIPITCSKPILTKPKYNKDDKSVRLIIGECNRCGTCRHGYPNKFNDDKYGQTIQITLPIKKYGTNSKEEILKKIADKKNKTKIAELDEKSKHIYDEKSKHIYDEEYECELDEKTN